MTAAYRINGETVSQADFYAVACDPARSVAVEACAGAGKTWMLVSRILRGLMEGTAPQDILAITFTKKAAGEMRQRLQEWLQDFATADDEALQQQLRLRGLPAAEAAARAADLRGLQAALLAQGRPVQIRTFHSWFAALLRAAPLAVLDELGLPAEQELLEDDERAMQKAWPLFHSQVAADPGLHADFMASVAQHGRSQTRLALQNSLQRRVEFGLADARGIVATSVQRFGERFPQWAAFDAPEQALAGASARARWLDWARALGRERNKKPRDAAAGVLEAFGEDDGDQTADALDGASTPDASTGPTAPLARRLARLRKLFFVSTEDRLHKQLESYEVAKAAEAELQALLAATRQHADWQHQQRMLRLTRALLAAYARVKREHGWVDMNDVEGAALRLLGDTELSGWLQQRLDARVRHLLIDEFQDTNPLQWQALYGWLSAYAGAGAGAAPSVFLVGDPKQSIYRFRRAEPQVFKAAQAFVVQGLGGALLSCDHTRRCATGIVEGLNQVMAAAAEASGYEGFRPHTTASDAPGALLALPPILRERTAGERAPEASHEAGNAGESDPAARAAADEAAAAEAPSGAVALPMGAPATETPLSEAASGGPATPRDCLTTPRLTPEDSWHALEARQAAHWIADELSQGRLQPQDMMVLSRKRDRLGWLHEALAERGIACDQPEKQDLCAAPAVQDVVALLDALLSPAHDLSLARALKSPIFGFDDEALARLAHQARSRAADVDGVRQSWWSVLMSHLPGAGTPGAGAAPGAGRTADLVSTGPVDATHRESHGQQAGTPAADACADEPFRTAAERLQRYRGWLHQWPPHDALAAIYRDSDLLARFAQAVPPPMRPAALASLRALLAQSLAQEGGRYLTAYRFVRALKAGGVAWPTAAPGAAVRLLTIHGAKGLESDTVLLLDTDPGPNRSNRMVVLVDWPGESAAPRRFVFLASESMPPMCAADLLAQEQRARRLEEINALYVALTRAENRVVISGVEPYQRPADGADSWWQRIAPHALPLPVPVLASSGSTARPADSALPAPAVSEAAGVDGCVLLELPLLSEKRPATGTGPLTAPVSPWDTTQQKPEQTSSRPGAETAVPSGSTAKPAAPAVARPEGTDRQAAGDDSRARTGRAVHRLMQWLPTPLNGFAWTAVHRQAVAREFGLSPDQAADALATAQAMLGGGAAWAWDAACLSHWGNEVDLWADGQWHRLDRLVRRADTGDWWVLDHKTALRPEQQADLREQLYRYHRALTQTLAAQAAPGDPVVVRLAFINLRGDLIELPPPEAVA